MRSEPCAVFDGKPCDCGMAGWALEAGGRHWEGIVVWSDLEFWFPCDDPFHCGCGFFEWTLCLETAEFLCRCIEENENGHDAWDFIIVVAPVIEQNRLADIARDWLERWVPQLAAKPVRAASYEESRRIWARFEEMHPDAEQVDVLRVCQQRIVEIEGGTAKLVSFDDVHVCDPEKADGDDDDL
jgi:hypothetical protein